MSDHLAVSAKGSHAAPSGKITPDLTALTAARQARAAHQLRFESGDHDVVRLPAGAAVDLIRRLADGVTSSVQQIVPLTCLPSADVFPTATVKRAPALRDADDFSHAVLRNLAELGRQIERIYLVPAGHVRAEAVVQRLNRDQHEGVESRCLSISDIEPELARRTPVSHVWIVDEQAVLFQEAMAEGPPVWTVSVRGQDLTAAQRLWAHLWKKGVEFQATDFDLIDPVVISADRIAAAAAMSCRPVDDTYEGCDWYHGVWQYLRLFDMVANPGWHDAFYREHLSERLGAVSKPRVLITGTADYSMLAYIFQAWKWARRDRGWASAPVPQIDVVDRCPTPLNACRWYAAAIKQNVRTHRMDIRDLAASTLGAGSYDLIAADDLLTGLGPDDCLSVMANWCELLADNGVIVTTIRVVSKDRGRPDVFDEVSEFAARARHSARRWRALLHAGVEDICDAARRYAGRISSVDHGNEGDISAMFEKAGLRVLISDAAECPGELTLSTYLRVVAAKIGSAVDPVND